jgi:hypothetical protein
MSPRFIYFILVILVINSCNMDQVESKYENYESAKNSGLFNKMWIPQELISESMVNIYLRTNLDMNTCIFSYSVSQQDIENLDASFQASPIEYIPPRGIKIPQWWSDIVANQDSIITFSSGLSYTFHFVIDRNTKTVSGWLN